MAESKKSLEPENTKTGKPPRNRRNGDYEKVSRTHSKIEKYFRN